MSTLFAMRRKRGFFTGVAIGIVGVGAILFLAQSVARDMRLLDTASSDNLQWALAQTEVEFMSFERQLLEAEYTSQPNLPLIRRRFDIFYSRVSTIEQSSIFAELRDLPNFSAHLGALRVFLDGAVGLIDADDAELTNALPLLQARAEAARKDVRGLSNSGLDSFARDADRKRRSVAVSLLQLATVLGLLMLLLIFLSAYLAHLNAVNVRRQKEISETSDRLRLVIENSLEGVIVADAKGRILDFSPSAEKIFGYSYDEAIGAELGALIVPDHLRDAHEAGLERQAAGGELHVVGKGRVRLEAKRANGEVFPVELALQMAETTNGRVYIGFMRDLTPEVKAEQELVAARDRALAGEKAKSDFLAVMSHEIRTPLNGLLGNLSLLEDTPLSAEQVQYVGNMQTSGRILMSHISDVLDLTKYDSGAQALRPVNMDLSALIQDIVDSQSAAATARDTSISWGWRGGAVSWIKADRERIQHILVNLVGNAVKFTDAGAIAVIAQAEKIGPTRYDITIRVKDTGVGIHEDLKTTIFDDFVTGDASYVRKTGGTGLGLGIARRLIEGMGGEIGVDSVEGEGSEFWIRFPAESVSGPGAASPEQVAAATEPVALDILLVEDNDINLFVAREMLTKAGHRVTEALNGKQAVELAEARRFDLIFMDISMPVMDGPTATKLIRGGDGMSATSPIIALTANVMANEQKEFLANGMDAVLTKPLTRETLAAMVAQFSEAAESAPVEPPKGAVVPPALRGIVEETEYVALMERLTRETRQFCAETSGRDEIDFGALKAIAHNLAGSAAFLSATEMRAILIEIERSAVAEDRDAVDELLRQLTDHLDRSVA